jgi:LacI family transcriptional regulator
MDSKPALMPGTGTTGQPERPTLKTIAFMTGLGITTVSRALKDAPDIGADTKERVRMVAAQIGYQPNRAGVRLRTGKTNVISLIFSLEEEVLGLTSQMVYGISEVLSKTQYNLTITPYSHSTDALSPVRYVLDTGSADGVIISRTEPDDARVRLLMERNFPFAAHGRTEMGLEHPYHDFDNEDFAYRAVEKLAARGRQRIAMLAPPPLLTFQRHLRDGFVAAIRDFGLEEVPFRNVTIDDSLSTIRAATEALMRGPNPPDGLVSASGAGSMAMTVGVEATGRKLGRDVDMVSKETTNILKWFRPELITAFEDVRLAGRELALSVLARIEGKDAASLQHVTRPEIIA